MKGTSAPSPAGGQVVPLRAAPDRRSPEARALLLRVAQAIGRQLADEELAREAAERGEHGERR